MTSKKQEAFQDTIKRMLREYSESFIVAIGIAVCLKLWVASSFYLPTDSMSPALISGDYVLGYKWPYTLGRWGFSSFELPKRGEVLVVFCPSPSGTSLDNLCLKRVVGLPGDRVEIIDGILHLNGQKAVLVKDKNKTIESHSFGSWQVQLKQEDFGPHIVPPGQIFLLGDNREISKDSRDWGDLPLANAVASVGMIWFSRGKTNSESDSNNTEPHSVSVRWDRIFHRVD